MHKYHKSTVEHSLSQVHNKPLKFNIEKVTKVKIVRSHLQYKFLEYKYNDLISRYKYLNQKTQLLKILQMSHHNEIFDVIQELQELIEVTPKKQIHLVKKQTLSSQETPSFEPRNLSEDESFSPKKGKTQKKCKRISKKKRTRKFRQNSKWTSQEQIKYWKFYVHYQITNPFEKISWIQWKRDSIYKTMAKYIGKQPGQCKSKDQNMKKKYLHPTMGNDVLQKAVLKLKQVQDQDDQIPQLLEQYHRLMTKNSEHMMLLDKKIALISQNKYQLDHLFDLF